MPDSSHPADPIDALQAQLVAARRTQILDAATRVFASKGFNRATIRDVAQDAGVADGTIYNYFANKTDLLFGLLDRLNDTERRPASLAQAAVLAVIEATASVARAGMLSPGRAPSEKLVTSTRLRPRSLAK